MKGFVRMLFMQATQKPKPLPASTDLSGKTALVTGANSGLGLETAKDLARAKIQRLILCVRNVESGNAARITILEYSSTCTIEIWPTDYLDYQSLKSCGERASALDRLDIVILNSGVRKLQFNTSSAGHEENVQVNHIGTAILSLLLYPSLLKTAQRFSQPTRLTFVSSIVHVWTPFRESQHSSILSRMDEKDSMISADIPDYERYHTSKLLSLLWMQQFSENLKAKKEQVVINAVNPGMCQSPLHRENQSMFYNAVLNWFGLTAAQGGHCISNAAVVQNSASYGRYISEQVVTEPSDFVRSKEGKDVQRRLWTETIRLIEEEIPQLEMPQFD